MKIKMIDLLVTIANGEKVPKKIKFMNSIWEYCKDGVIQDYINNYDKCLMEFIAINKDGLNDEVEIIEESKMIEKLELESGKIDDKEFVRIEAMICSMTKAERKNPKLLNGSRRVRIAKGSGTSVQEINKFMKSFEMTQKMMKQMQNNKGGIKKMMKNMDTKNFKF